MMVGRDAVPAGEIRTLVPGRSPEQRPGEGPTRPVNRERPIARIPRGAPEVAGTPAQVVLRARRYRACPSDRAVRRNPDNAPCGAPLPSLRGRKRKRTTGEPPRPPKQQGPDHHGCLTMEYGKRPRGAAWEGMTSCPGPASAKRERRAGTLGPKRAGRRVRALRFAGLLRWIPGLVPLGCALLHSPGKH